MDSRHVDNMHMSRHLHTFHVPNLHSCYVRTPATDPFFASNVSIFLLNSFLVITVFVLQYLKVIQYNPHICICTGNTSHMLM